MMQADAIHAVGGGWGGAGLQGRGTTTAREMIERAGLGFKVEGRPVFDGRGQPIDGFKAITRADDGHVFSVMGKGYGILQPSEALDLLDSAAGLGECSYTSAGSFDHGARIFVTAALPDEIRIGREDVVKAFLAAFNSYDGSTAAILKGLTFRPICQNTYMRALRTEKDTELRCKHTSNVAARMVQAAEALKAARYNFAKLGETFKALARAKFTDAQMREMAATLVPAEPNKETGKIPTQAVTARETLVTLFSQGRGQRELSDVRGTMWAAFNATTEYVDHLRPTRVRASANEDESRQASAWLGSGAALKDQALSYLEARL